MTNLQTPHAGWLKGRFRKAKALCVRKAATPDGNAKYLGATGVLHHDVARSEQFFESYAQVDPDVTPRGDGVSHLDEIDMELSHLSGDTSDLSHLLSNDFDPPELDNSEALLQMLREHEPELPEQAGAASPESNRYRRSISLSSYEYEIIRQKVQEAGCKFNTYVRAALLGSDYQQPMDKDIRQALLGLNHELTKQGNNINQIARHLNAGIRTPTQANQALEAMRPEYLQTLKAIRTALSFGMEEPAL